MRALKGFDRRAHVFTVDALRFSLAHEARVYARLWRNLRVAEREAAAMGISAATTLRALATAWEIIDTVNRIRVLGLHVAGMRTKDPEVKLFQQGTVRAEELRNFFQHLNSAIPKLEGNTTPILGVISWATRQENDSLSICVGSDTTDIGIPGMIIDTHTMRFASRLYFSAAGITVDMEDLHKRARRFNQFLNKWLANTDRLSEAKIGVSTFRSRIG